MSGKYCLKIVGFIFILSASAHASFDLTCKSKNNNYVECGTDEKIERADLVQQLSQSNCIQGSTYGWQDHFVWVNNGCKGVFRVTPHAGTVSLGCGSFGGNYEECAVSGPKIDRVRIVEQDSNAPCIMGQTWGWQDHYVWVNNGCRGVFEADLHQ